MNHQEISIAVQEAWADIDKGFSGPRIKGVWLVDCRETIAMPRLNSSIYTNRLEERCFMPDMPKPFDECYEHPVPQGVFFRAEIATKRGNDEQFLAALCEGTGNSHEFKAYFLTNDPRYAETHPHITWKQ